MQYLKHYWIHVHSGTYCGDDNPVEKRHPEAEFPGLDVRIWAHDQDGIDVCLSYVPDGVPIVDIVDDHNGKKLVQQLTETEFNSVKVPLDESQALYQEYQQETDETIKEQKRVAAEQKYQEAMVALHAL